MTTENHKAKPTAVLARKERNGKCKQAYEHWVKNPYLRLVDVGDKFLVSPDAIRYWVQSNGLKRPDGKGFRPVVSDRKQTIIDTYNEAVRLGKDANWAVNKANEGTGKRSINKGDFVYYAVKNDLPELPNPKTHLSATKYG